MIQWAHYPRSRAPSDLARAVVQVFEQSAPQISSASTQLSSNQVLDHISVGLTAIGFNVESGKKKTDRIHVPVLFGTDGRVAKSFDADAYHEKERFVLEVEAGRAVANNQFLKDLFQACMMQDVDHLAIAVRNLYEGGNQSSRDFDRVVAFFDTLYASSRLRLPLEEVVIIGY